MGEVLLRLIEDYGTQFLYAAIVAIAGFLGNAIKNIIKKYLNDKTKKDVAKTCVRAVEQIYKDLHGEEKLNKALESVSDVLLSKGITVTDIELRMLIESAVGEFNQALKDTSEKNK